jgi:hypothetical protein
MLYIKKIEGAIYSCTHDLARAKLKKAMASLDHCYGLDARGELISPFGRKLQKQKHERGIWLSSHRNKA